MNKCLNCKNKTNNPKFCCRSCSATYTNKENPKRPRSKKCKTCDTLILSSRMFCKKCNNLRKIPPDYTLQDAIYDNHHRSSAFALIRNRARTILKNLNASKCSNCGYDKHFEVCHIKSISSFSNETRLSVINDPTNLIPLCPNCHWEFDRGHLKISKN